MLDLLADERVTITAGVPTVWMAILEAIEAEPERWDLSALDHLIVGGSAAPPSMMERFDRFGLTIIHAWGMTETSPLGSVSRPPAELDDASGGGAPALPRTAGHGLAVRRDPGT